MTPATGERTSPRAAAAPQTWLTVVCVAVIVGAFLVRVAGVVEPLGMDQGIFATAGWGLRRGLMLYRDLWDQKPPGLHLSYLLAFVVFGERAASVFWLDFVAAALTACVLFDLGRRAAGRRLGLLAAAVFAVGTLPAARYALGGFLERAIAETFISLVAASAAWATMQATTRASRAWSFAAGLCIGAACVFKPTAAVYWPAFVLYAWLVGDGAKARRYAFASAAGLLIAPLAVVTWLYDRVALHDGWIAVVQYNAAYAGAGQGLWNWVDRFAHEVFRRMKTDEVWLAGSIAALAALATWRWRARQPVAWLGVCWLGASVVAAAANGAYALNTYFVPPLVPLCVLIAWLLDWALAGRGARVTVAVLLLAAAGAMAVRSGSGSRAIAMTAWDAGYLVGRMPQEEYLGRFRSRSGHGYSAPDNARLAEYLRGHTASNDRIYLFGMAASTYFESGRLPANRFLWVYPAVSHLVERPEFHVEALAADLSRAAPRYLILQRYNANSYTGWRAETDFASPPMTALLQQYQRETEIGDFVLYRRLEPAR